MANKTLSSLSVFFPAYNEEENITDSVQQARAVAGELAETYEIIIVDDGSSDRTSEIADKLAAADPEHVRVVHHRPNRGYGGAVMSGLYTSQCEYVFFTDADLQFDLSELKKLVAFVPEYEVVIGYRAPRMDPFMRKVNAWGWGVLNSWLFDLHVKDIDCAFKLFHRPVLKEMHLQSHTAILDKLKSQGAMLSAELLIRLQRSGITFKEVPVKHLPRERGSPTGAKPGVILRAFQELIEVFSGDLGQPMRRKFVRFASVGVVNTLIDIGAYTLLTRLTAFFDEQLLAAKTLSFLLGSAFSFVANRSWTFAVPGRATITEVVKFYVTVGTSLAVNVFATYVFLTLGLFDILAVILATGVTLIWNFLFLNHWVFKSSTSSQPAQPDVEDQEVLPAERKALK